ncbi:MAG: TolC family outer membrane protein [candidate division WOR-3 bacterium]
MGFLFFSLILFIFSFSGTANGLDLLECYNKAKEYEPYYLSVYHEYRAAQTLPKQALASLLPQIEVNYRRMKYDFESAPQYYVDYTAESTSILLQQALFQLPLIFEYKKSNLKKLMGEKKFKYVEQELIKRVTDAYFETLYYEENLKILEEEKKAIFEQVKMIKKLLDAGEATLTDLYDAEAKYSNIQFRIIEAEKNFFIAKNNLRRIVGEEINFLAKLDESIVFYELEPSTIEDWIAIAKENNNLIKYYSISKDVANFEVKKQISERLPKVSFVAGYTETNTIEYIKTYPLTYYSFGFQIRLPIFTGGYITAKEKEAKELFEKAQKDYESAVSDVVQEIFNNFFGVKTALAQIYSAESALRASEIALESSKKGYKAGIRTIVDVLNAESNFYRAKLELVKAKYDYIKYLVGLKYYAGVLNEEDVKKINQWLIRR